jgi:hypothetical protein
MTPSDEAVGVTAPARIDSWMGVEFKGTIARNFCPTCADSVLDTTRSRGALPRSALEILAWRFSELDDPIFMMVMSLLLGSLAGLGVFSVLALL